jgi:hypothetical protein
MPIVRRSPARVDVWHSDASGVVAFGSIYPGRTPHIQDKVFLDDRTLLAS